MSKKWKKKKSRKTRATNIQKTQSKLPTEQDVSIRPFVHLVPNSDESPSPRLSNASNPQLGQQRSATHNPLSAKPSVVDIPRSKSSEQVTSLYDHKFNSGELNSGDFRLLPLIELEIPPESKVDSVPIATLRSQFLVIPFVPPYSHKIKYRGLKEWLDAVGTKFKYVTAVIVPRTLIESLCARLLQANHSLLADAEHRLPRKQHLFVLEDDARKFSKGEDRKLSESRKVSREVSTDVSDTAIYEQLEQERVKSERECALESEST